MELGLKKAALISALTLCKLGVFFFFTPVILICKINGVTLNVSEILSVLYEIIQENDSAVSAISMCTEKCY